MIRRKWFLTRVRRGGSPVQVETAINNQWRWLLPFIGLNDAAMIYSDDYFIYTRDLSRVVADETKGIGSDTLAAKDIDFELIEIGNWN